MKGVRSTFDPCRGIYVEWGVGPRERIEFKMNCLKKEGQKGLKTIFLPLKRWLKEEYRCHELTDISFRITSGILPIDAINENFYLNLPEIDRVI